MATAVEQGSAASLAQHDTASGDKRALAAFGRTAEFWRRASGIYLAYKAAQVRVSLRAGAKPERKAEFWQKHHTWAGKEMYKLCIDLRGFYLKVGQFLGARGDFVPVPICLELSRLHDQVPPMTPEKTRAVIEERLGKKLDEVFAWIDLDKPLGSASIAQVHKAKLKFSGTVVAVKVQYPESLNIMLQDLANIRLFAAFLSKTEIKFDMVSAVDELAAQIKLEFDFEREARIMNSISKHLQGMTSSVAVPQSIPGLVTKDLLVMTFLEGEQITRLKDHTAGLSAWQKKEAAKLILSRICEAYGRMLLLQGLFQADCHPGNILVMKGGKIGIIDYGQSKQLPPRDRLALANLIIALVDKDLLRVSQTMDKLGIKTSSKDAAVRAKFAYGMFDTSLKVDPFAPDDPLKTTSVDNFPPDMFFVLRVVQLIRGLAVNMGVENFSSAAQWKPFAVQALATRQQQLKKSDWRKAYSADSWFSEGGLVPGGRSRKDASWYRSLRKPAWGLPTYMFRPIWVALYSLMTVSALLMWKRPPPLYGVPHRRIPMFCFSLQLACNLAWGFCFFKLRSPSAALKCSSAYMLLLTITMITFHWALPLSATLLLPVLVWAITLFTWNHNVWRNNREGKPNARLRTLVEAVQERVQDIGGGTMSDDEDMAWGEQAQLAVEANAPHKKFDSSDKDPRIHRRSVNRNFMRCLPEGQSRLVRADRAPFLGHDLRDSRLHAQATAPCRALPSHQTTAPCSALPQATASCMALLSAPARSPDRHDQQQQLMKAQKIWLQQQHAALPCPPHTASISSAHSPDRASVFDGQILYGSSRQVSEQDQSLAEPAQAGVPQHQGSDWAPSTTNPSLVLDSHGRGLQEQRLTAAGLQLAALGRQLLLSSSWQASCGKHTALCLPASGLLRPRRSPRLRLQTARALPCDVPVAQQLRVLGKHSLSAQHGLLTGYACSSHRLLPQCSSSQTKLLAQGSGTLLELLPQSSRLCWGSDMRSCKRLRKLSSQSKQQSLSARHKHRPACSLRSLRTFDCRMMG